MSLRNGVTTGEVNKCEERGFVSVGEGGGVSRPLHPSPRSAPPAKD